MSIINFLTQPYGKLAVLDVLIIATYMLICLYIGFRKAGKIRNIRDFALGGGTISTAMLVATIYATHLGAGSTIGYMEKIYTAGLFFAIPVLLEPLGWIVTALIFARNIDKFRDCISLTDIMAKLYGNSSIWIINFVTILCTTAIVAAQANVLGYLLHYYFDISNQTGIILSLSVMITYSVLGGVRAIVLTDMLQFIVFYIAFPCLCAIGLYKIGATDGIRNVLPAEKLQIDLSGGNAYLFLGLVINALMPCVDAPFIQRFLMSENVKQLMTSLKAAVLLDIFMSLILCSLGFIVAIAFPEALTPKAALLDTIHNFLPIGIAGVVIAGLLAVVMSTADSHLNTAGIIMSHDILKRLLPNISELTEVLFARISTIFIGVLSIYLALSGSSILELIWIMLNFYTPIIVLPLAAGFLGFTSNSNSFIAAVVCAMFYAMIGFYMQSAFDVVSLLLGLAGSAIGLFGMHYYQIYTGRLERRQMPRPKKDSFNLSKYIGTLIKSLRKINSRSILNKINRSIAQDPPSYYAFAVWGIIYCLYPLLLLVVAGDADTINSFTLGAILYIIGAIGCVILLFHEIWMDSFREKYLGIYWYALLLWCLPMLAMYGLMLRGNDWLWLIHAAMSLFILVAFTNCQAATLILVLGSIIGLLLSFLDFDSQLLLARPTISHKLNETVVALIYFALALGISREIISKIQKNVSLSTTDALTSLFNKRYLNLHLDNIIEDAHSEGADLCVIMIDMDHFGQVNKQYGHQSGDAVLRELGRRLKQNISLTDVCVRYGGEEFLILSPKATLEEAKKMAEHLLDVIRSTPFTIPAAPNSITCTTSIGVAALRQREDSNTLIARADAALKMAKQKRNMLVVEENDSERIYLHTQA